MFYRQVFISIFLSIIFLFPLYLVFVNSFKFENDILNNPASFPELFTFNNYINIFVKEFQYLLYKRIKILIKTTELIKG